MQRDETLDIIKGIGILLVLWGHIATLNDNLHHVIYSFHMPLFFLVSGLLHHEKGRFIAHKAKALMIPYLVFALAEWAYWMLIERRFVPYDNPWLQLANIFIPMNMQDCYIFNANLWFLPTLFNIAVLYYLLCKIVKNGLARVLLLTTAAIMARIASLYLPFWLDNAIFYLPFYAVGHRIATVANGKGSNKKSFYALLNEKTQNTNSVANKSLVATAAAIWLAIVAAITISTADIDPNLTQRPALVVMFYLMAPITVLILYALCNSQRKNLGFMKWFGVNSLIIFLIQTEIKRPLMIAYSHVAGIEVEVLRASYGHSFIVAVLNLLACVPAVIIINKYMPWAIGKSNTKE